MSHEITIVRDLELFNSKDYKTVALCQIPQYFSIVCKTLGYQPLFFVARDEGEIVNILPVARIQLPFLGAKLVSMPLDGTFGGPFFWDPSGYELIKSLIDYGRREKVNYIDIRSSEKLKDMEPLGFQTYAPYMTSDIELSEIEVNRKKLSKGHRAAVTFAKKNGFVTEYSNSVEDLDAFYRMFAVNFRAFGSPVFPRKYFERLWKTLAPSGDLLLMKGIYQGKMVSGIMLLFHGEIAIYKYGAAYEEFLFLRPYQAMLWQAIDFSIAKGMKRFNMGITPKTDDGLLKFKERFGAFNHEAYSYVLSISGTAPDYEKLIHGYAIVRKLWKRLPLWLTRIGGELVYHWVC